VIGKVTQLWPSEDDFVNLYRRSVLSLVPSLVQTVTWNMLGFLFALAKSLPADETEQAAWEISGMKKPGAAADQTADADAVDDSVSTTTVDGDDVVIGEEAVNALHPGVNGPAFQVLPLAICA
jgi:hypothetical protein